MQNFTESYATNTYDMRQQQQKVQDIKQCRYITPDWIITSKFGDVSQHQPPDLIDNHNTDKAIRQTAYL